MNLVRKIITPEFAVGIALLLLAVALGYIFRGNLTSPLVSDPRLWNRSILFWGNSLVGLAAILPVVVAFIALWMAFVRRDCSSRYLWTGIVILTSLNVASFMDYLPVVPRASMVGTQTLFINVLVFPGIIAYAALFFWVRQYRRPGIAVLPLLVMAAIIATPLLTSMITWRTAACSICAALGYWFIVVAIARAANLNVYGMADGAI